MNNKYFCDLHTHSNCSDGTLTPNELVKLAEENNLSAVALCDHNTISGLDDFINATNEYDIEAVPGIEISAEYNGKEVHILGLFIKESYYQKLNNYVNQINIAKENSNIELEQKLHEAGYNVSYTEIKQKAEGTVNRAHFAKDLLNKGYVSSITEAFDTILSEETGYYISPKRLDALDVIEFLASIEALPVMAHPLINLTMDELHEFLPIAKQKGLVAMEVKYSLYSEEETEQAMKLAEKYDLLYSGGSDFHGENKPDISIGTGKGNLSIPTGYYEELKMCLK